jgi:thiol-disulfide isomerase/thioredoxin
MKLSELPSALSNRKFLIILFLTICFLVAAIYTYKKFVTPRVNQHFVNNNEFNKGPVSEQAAELYFFYTNWCPHCKTAKPVWQALKKKLEGKRINGYEVAMIEIDCEKDTTTADSFNVKGYPTIKLVKNNQVIEYDAKPDEDTLMEFLQTSL